MCLAHCRTQCSVPGHGLYPDRSFRSRAHNHEATALPDTSKGTRLLSCLFSATLDFFCCMNNDALLSLALNSVRNKTATKKLGGGNIPVRTQHSRVTTPCALSARVDRVRWCWVVNVANYIGLFFYPSSILCDKSISHSLNTRKTETLLRSEMFNPFRRDRPRFVLKMGVGSLYLVT